MEDENIVNTEKQSSIIPALALLGLGIGAVAFALGIMAMVKVGDTAKEMNDKIEKATALSLETRKISDRIDSLAMQIEEVKSSEKNRVSNMVSQINEEFKRIYANINDTRKSVSETREIIEKLATRQAQVSTTSPTRKVTQAEAEKVKAEANAKLDAAEKSEQKTSGDVKKHVIENGDTFAKLAKKYGVSVNAIVTANPDANPSRLKIGQEIIIP